MQVELQGGVFLPGEGEGGPVGRVVPDHPEEDERDDAVQEDLGDQDQEGQAARGAARHRVVVVFAVPATKRWD